MPTTHKRGSGTRRRRPSTLATRLSTRVRKFMRSPVVRAAIRYAVFKH